ncbi:hypothetical protein C8J30_1244 [Rhodobacter viridis]|uniref:Uncharacterized protein n=1 Tax=Rhodobacter viridis TaxID=1054202 RepID=A0A318TPE3_9RHOB|nr:hypothetical protein [Rhodobacter viridis]PYF06722.1 hypothetical protein C8J30_1244 [Rhodobacter viridis]
MIPLAEPDTRAGGKSQMTTHRTALGTSPKARFPHARPAQTGLGWREFFERLGQGTLPQGPRRQNRPALDPIRSFNGHATQSEFR